jgi:hypothetical protein
MLRAAGGGGQVLWRLLDGTHELDTCRFLAKLRDALPIQSALLD